MKKIILPLLALGGIFLSTPYYFEAQAEFKCKDMIPAKFELAFDWAIDEGIIKGNPDGTCKPNELVNKIGSAVMIMRATIGDDDAQTEQCSSGMFKDINEKECKGWYGKYLATAKKQGIIKGNKDGKSEVNKSVNAAEASVIAARAYELEPYPAQNGESWYGPTFRLYKDHNVNTYDPNHLMTRGEIIQMMFEINNNYHILTDVYGDSHLNNNDSTQNSEQPQLNQPTTHSNNSGNFKAVNSLRYLAENFDNLSSAQVNELILSLNESQMLQFSIYNAFASLAHARACEVNTNLIVNIPTPTDCASTLLSWQQSLQFSGGNWQQATSYAYQNRDQMLIGMKCGTGEIDAGSCGLYSNIQQQNINAMDQIFQNMISECSYNGQVLPDGAVCISN